MPQSTKTCTVCRVEQELSQFGKQRSAKGGLCPRCKTCDRKRSASRDKDKEAAYHKRWYAENGEKKKAKQKQRNDENRAEVNAKAAASRAADPEKEKEKHRRYRTKHREKRNEAERKRRRKKAANQTEARGRKHPKAKTHGLALPATTPREIRPADRGATSPYGPRSGVVRVAVYVAYCHGYIKIGLSQHPEYRISSMRGFCPFPITLLAAWWLPADKSSAVEASVMRALGEFHHIGEWFRCSKAEALYTAEKIALPIGGVPWKREITKNEKVPRQIKPVMAEPSNQPVISLFDDDVVTNGSRKSYLREYMRRRRAKEREAAVMVMATVLGGL